MRRLRGLIVSLTIALLLVAADAHAQFYYCSWLVEAIYQNGGETGGWTEWIIAGYWQVWVRIQGGPWSQVLCYGS